MIATPIAGDHLTDPAHVERAVQIAPLVPCTSRRPWRRGSNRRELLSNPRRAVDEIRADESVLFGKLNQLLDGPSASRRPSATNPSRCLCEPRAERERQQRGDDDARAVLGPPRPTPCVAHIIVVRRADDAKRTRRARECDARCNTPRAVLNYLY